jgi:hypothetical protein
MIKTINTMAMATKLDRVPVASYLNADTDKLKIIKDNKGKSGIYR